jgi:anti-sigma regulatory factor (Ser/Thr protein kinase)
MVVTARSLRVEAELARLAEVRQFVRSAASAAGAPEACRSDIVQAVDEAATNAIVHGYAGRPGWIEVTAGVDDGRFVVRLEDGAPEFDPTTVPEPDLNVPPMARRPGGMGVHLMRACTDTLTHRPRPGGGNILTFVRAIGPDWQEEG